MSSDTDTFIQLRRLHERIIESRKKESDACKIAFTLPPDMRIDMMQNREFIGIRGSLASICRDAQEDLRIAIAYLTLGGLDDFIEMMGDACKTSARIRIVFRECDVEIINSIISRFSVEIGIGKISIRFRSKKGGGGLHGKVAICDTNKALVMSANWTERSMKWNDEVGVETSSKEAIELLVKWFELLWDHSTPYK